MHRKEFIKSVGLTSLAVPMISPLNKLESLSESLQNSDRMPVLFLGHGSPMNAIEENEFVQEFRKQGKALEKPQAIVVVSAHWETKGSYVTAMENPRTIHDFGGFPKELYEEQYPAPGSPSLAQDISDLVQPAGTVSPDHSWGLDHGSWTVVKHLFPEADVPVIQLSLDYTKPAAYHYELGRQLAKLRDRGILIIGSGNIIHNLRRVAWDKLDQPYAYDWAAEADQKIKGWILNDDHQPLIDFRNNGKAFDLSIPTPEHYLPLLYALALKGKKEELMLFNDQPLGGSLSMTSVKIG